jgi:hypothetical protein
MAGAFLAELRNCKQSKMARTKGRQERVSDDLERGGLCNKAMGFY